MQPLVLVVGTGGFTIAALRCRNIRFPARGVLPTPLDRHSVAATRKPSLSQDNLSAGLSSVGDVGDLSGLGFVWNDTNWCQNLRRVSGFYLAISVGL